MANQALVNAMMANQFSMPRFAPAPRTNPTQYMDAATKEAEYRNQVYNALAKQAGETQGGVFKLGGAGVMYNAPKIESAAKAGYGALQSMFSPASPAIGISAPTEAGTMYAASGGAAPLVASAAPSAASPTAGVGGIGTAGTIGGAGTVGAGGTLGATTLGAGTTGTAGAAGLGTAGAAGTTAATVGTAGAATAGTTAASTSTLAAYPWLAALLSA